MKKVLVIVLSMILTISIIGCSTNDLEDYRKAVIKTNEINKGQMSYEVIIETNFNTEGLSKEEIKELNYFSKIDTSADMSYDNDHQKAISRNYFNFGGMGFDSSFYIDGERMFMKMPIIGKYIEFSETKGVNDRDVAMHSENGFISDDSLKTMKDKWNNILTEDDVFSGEDTLLTTPDGEVKATLYTIKLTEEQINSLVNDYIDVLFEDETFTVNLLKGIVMNMEGEGSVSTDDIYKNIKELVDNVSIESFELQSYIDIDGYIVAEDLEMGLKLNESLDAKAESIRITMEVNRWDIEEEQEFDFPELNEDNTMDMENFQQGIPFIFEDVFQDKDKEGGK